MINSTRRASALAILVAGACTADMNWRFSYQLGRSELDRMIGATFSVALDVAKGLMLPFAVLGWRNRKLRAAAAVAIWLDAGGFPTPSRQKSLTERRSLQRAPQRFAQ